MTTMKALRFDKYGPPSVLSIQELQVPDLSPGEALVELRASAINPSDVKNVAGVFKASLPRIPGRDFAGCAPATLTQIDRIVAIANRLRRSFVRLTGSR